MLAGCGTQPLTPPDPLRVREPGHSVKLLDPRTGIRFVAPLNWVKRIRTNPGMFRIASGAADVSGWAYPRYEKLPRTRAELERARTALIEQPGNQRILGRTIETHSIHVYRVPGEYVFEALAPPSSFGTADQKVLAPL